MAALCGLSARALFFLSMLLGIAYAGFCCQPEKRHENRERHRAQMGTKQSSSNTSYGSASCGSPQLPNRLPPTSVDPARFLGKWYSYKHWYPGITDERSSTNAVQLYVNMLNGNLTFLPATSISAVAVEILNSRIDRTTKQCTKLPGYLDYLTVTGQFSGFGYNGPKDIYVDNPTILSTDYDNYVLFYVCDEYDSSSGLCADPTVYVQTRMRPDQVPATVTSAIDTEANRILARYCFDAKLFKMSTWEPYVPECPFVQPTDDCYNSLRNAYTSLG